MRSAILWPCSSVTPGSTPARVAATWSKVLWLSLRTITRQLPPRPEPGPAVRGRSIVPVDMLGRLRRLKGAGNPDHNVVDAADDPVAVLDRADDDRGGTAGELAGAGVDRFADE